MNINQNISSVKKGETICYHYGILTEDRQKGTFNHDTKEKDLTDEAVALNNVASDIYDMAQDGKFILYQKRGEWTGKRFNGRLAAKCVTTSERLSRVPPCKIYNYFYMAKKIK